MTADRQVSAPLVLVLVSGMLSVGVMSWLWVRAPETPAAVSPTTLIVDATTPERAAESFLDAWRKREHEVATDLTAGVAHQKVAERAASDARMTEHERELKVRLWDAMASGRLDLLIDEMAYLDEERVRVAGIASGTLLGEPYERQMQFWLRPAEAGVEADDAHDWRVDDFEFGEILTEVPRVLKLGQ